MINFLNHAATCPMHLSLVAFMLAATIVILAAILSMVRPAPVKAHNPARSHRRTYR